MYKDFEKVLITKEQVDIKVKELANQLSIDYKDKNPLFIGILKGSVFFITDLLKNLSTPAQLEFMSVSSYGNSSSTTGEVKVLKDVNNPICDRHVVIVEDIVDSGVTLSYLKKLLLSRNPKSLRICTFLDKPDRRRTEIKIDYCGYEVPDEFLVGYGLDYAEKYRQYPEIYVLKKEVYTKKGRTN